MAHYIARVHVSVYGMKDGNRHCTFSSIFHICRNYCDEYGGDLLYHMVFRRPPSLLTSSCKTGSFSDEVQKVWMELLLQTEKILAKHETLVYAGCGWFSVIYYVLCLLQIKEFEGKETAQLVDRYKFLDLYPCTAAELR
jgi:hypothetical protein